MLTLLEVNGVDVPPQLVTAAELARQRGCSKQAISKRAAQLAPAKTEDGLYNLARALEILGPAQIQHHTTARTTPHRQPVEDAGTFHAARTKREEANAQLAELQLAEQQARLIDRAAAATSYATAIRRLRDALLQLPREHAGELSRMPTEAAIEARLTQILKQALTTYATAPGPDTDL